LRQVDRRDPLGQAALERVPLPRADHPREEVERKIRSVPASSPYTVKVMPCVRKAPSASTCRLRSSSGETSASSLDQRAVVIERVLAEQRLGQRGSRRLARNEPHVRSAGSHAPTRDRRFCRITVDADVGQEPRVPGAIDDSTAADHKVKCACL
jgi:hypothetical protein